MVDLVDENGNIVDTKKRRQINKGSDLYHTVFVVLKTPDNLLILSKIPRRQDLPNLYEGALGPTVSTIRRHQETPETAANRALKNELFIDTLGLSHLGDSYSVLPDGHKKYMSVYCGNTSLPDNFSRKDIEELTVLSRIEILQDLENYQDKFSLTFLEIWKNYQQKLFPTK